MWPRFSLLRAQKRQVPKDYRLPLQEEFKRAKAKLDQAFEVFSACNQPEDRIRLATEVMIYVSPVRILTPLDDEQQVKSVISCFRHIKDSLRAAHDPAIDPSFRLLDYADAMAGRAQSMEDHLAFHRHRKSSF